MADRMTISNFPDSGSKEQVAFEMLKWMRDVKDEAARKRILDQYAECLKATSGLRDG